jgi:putative ABC transport system permease protein
MRSVLTTVRLALRDLRQQLGFTVFFTLNLALGLVGAIALSALQESIEDTLAERSRSFLAADLRVAASRPLHALERDHLERIAKPRATSELITLYTMVAAPGHSRLVEVRAIDARFPLAGAVVLERAGPSNAAAFASLRDGRGAWVDPSLPHVLAVALGEQVKIGGMDFTLSDTVLRDTGLAVRSVSFGPRIYIAADHVRGTGLIQAGSRIEYQTLVALAPGDSASEIASRLREVLSDPALSVATHEEATAAVSGAYSRVTRYLGAVSLIALCLAGVACAYAFRTYLAGRIADLAILMSLGAARRRAQTLLVLELALLGAAAATIALILAAFALPVAGRSLADILPASIELAVGGKQAVAAYTVALVFGPLSCLPFLARLARLRVAELFQEHVRVELTEARSTDALWYLPAFTLVALLAWWTLREAAQAAAFMAIVVVAAAALSIAARALLGYASRIDAGARIPLKLALRQLSPQRRASRTAFIALALAALLLALPAQMRALLDQRLSPPPTKDIPSLFLFDIQPDQTEPLQALVQQEGTRLQRLAPMVRARLDAINRVAVKDDGGPGDGFRGPRRLRTRRYNLTYQSELAPTERLVAGRDFSGEWDFGSDALPEISMEVEFAADLGVGVGDSLQFDVQGVPVQGRIANLRAVEWNSMQPNFFVSFQPGVLESAPAVFLASIPALSPTRRRHIQNTIVDEFPNISLIDMTRGIDRILNLINQLQWAMGATTLTALLVGFLLIVAIARDEARARRSDVNLLKVLGAGHRILRRSVDTEFALLATAAAVVGATMALTIGAVLAHAFFETTLVPASLPLLTVLIVLPVLTVATARVATRRVLASRPSLWLR